MTAGRLRQPGESGPAADLEAAGACDDCLARSWLLSRLTGNLELARGRIDAVLALPDAELVAAVAGSARKNVLDELTRFDAAGARQQAVEAGLELVCRCDRAYPARLRELEQAPAVLHVAGGLRRFVRLIQDEPVAVVGARRASSYGLELARGLGRGLGAAGLTVLSGMALGVDRAAHTGALSGDGATVAVLPGGAERPYPPSQRGLHRQILGTGATVSELPPGAAVRRWAFPARNRIIAGLAAMTVVVEAGHRSGALVTARYAERLGRPVGAVPGRVGASQADGPNALLAAGAHVVRGPQDVLDTLYGAGGRAVPAVPRSELRPELARLRSAIAEGHDTAAAIAGSGIPPEQGLAALAALELGGHIRRGPGGRFVVIM
ncbi:MAG: DNA-processing protein DprA [Actinomycetota bacterium]|nr:DNA-processing protein DprA [Actinomycetota bacterium]